MKSIVELVIHAPRPKVAALFAEPRHSPKWMSEIEWVEPVRGDLGETGSAYRLVPTHGRGAFVATVVARRLPDRLKLVFERPDVSVAIEGKFIRISEGETKLISEGTISFKGVFGAVIGLFAQRAIKRAHRSHMERFKELAENSA